MKDLVLLPSDRMLKRQKICLNQKLYLKMKNKSLCMKGCISNYTYFSKLDIRINPTILLNGSCDLQPDGLKYQFLSSNA